MHLLIPFAFCSSEGCATALRSLKLPQLEKLLARLAPGPLDQGDLFSLSPPHERALARALGLPVADGMIAWAALDARQSRSAGGAWGFITPCHWQVGSKHVVMSGSILPDFPEPESQALLAAMQPYFEEDGISLHYQQASTWLAHGELFDGLASASLDRVAGRQVAGWLPPTSNAAKLLRLQSEMQMLLYNHPVNDARAARGAVPVNSFWLSGTGALPQPPQPAAADPAPQVVNSLREAALNEDWAAWAQAWTALDATECATLLKALAQGDSVQLTLCGERHAQTFGPTQTSRLTRLKQLFGNPPAATVLEQL
ncbi:MAG: phosphoglycerate mutase [Rhodoferax sp.]|uniref:phosphoglycerate mutase n=1 Tax=Rhodoferax sp. TaxID=50421 RepID=UPI00260A2972|nr:phosphoglycerate mutase [Rhodoferax sp.]MDD5333119.1 phosphoglycerate mutase [Rhodoferax sp.]